MLTMVLIMAATAIAACGVVIIIAGIAAPRASRSPIEPAPRRRAF